MIRARGELMPLRINTAEDFAAAFDVSRETLDRLRIYADLLVKWQKTINLVAPSTLPDLWHRHFADSAQVLALAEARAQRWLDLGSGAGFPGLVIAILLAGQHASEVETGDDRPSAKVTLIESDSRKCAFMAEVVRKTGISSCLPVDIANRRIESAPTQISLESAQTITARALAPLDRLLELSAPYVSSDTVALFLKGRDALAELEQAKQRWDFQSRLWPSRTDPAAQIVEIRGLEAKTEG
jgi:16S rRNA (guanine527-N7)-methyltransferase